MSSYEQISSVERDLYKLLSEFQYVINDNSFKDVFDAARKYKLETALPNDFPHEQRDKVMSMIYTCYVNRIPREDAYKMILNTYYYEPIILKRAVDNVYIMQNHRMRSQKIYAAHMLKKAGISNKKIAATLGVSTTTSAQYLKIKLDFKS